MTRLSMPSALPADFAERLSDLADDISLADQAAIDRLAAQKLTERLYGDLPAFQDLMAGIDPTAYEDQLQRALRELDAACRGDQIARCAIFAALTQIQCVVKAEAVKAWSEELREEAETEVLGVE